MRILSMITVPIGSLYIMALAEGMLQTSIVWTTLLFMNHVGFTDIRHHHFYILMSSLEYAVPIFANIPMALCANKFSARRTIMFVNLLLALSMLLLLICRFSRFLYAIAILIFALFWSVRIIRMSFIARLTSAENRTPAIAGHQFLLSFGTIFGPILWYLAQFWRGSFVLLNITFDRFSILFFVNCISLSLMGLNAYLFLPQLPSPPIPSSSTSSVAAPIAQGASEPTAQPPNNNTSTVMGRAVAQYDATERDVQELPDVSMPSPADIARRYVIFFCSISFLVRASSGIYIVAFQPILVDIFLASDATVAKISLVCSLCLFLSPLLAGILSKILDDRTLIVIGLSAQLLGMTLFLPILGTISQTQVVIGFIFIVQATLFFTTTSISLFTKLMGPVFNHTYVSYIWTSAMFGTAIAQVSLLNWIVSMFKSWSFMLYSLPTAAVIILVVTPQVWTYLSPPRAKEDEIFDKRDL